MSDSPTVRQELLSLASQLVSRDRNNTYGPPTQDFTRTANILNALGFCFKDAGGTETGIYPHHVALLMIGLKMSRATWEPLHKDTWVDIAGYAACGWECVVEPMDKSPKNNTSTNSAGS